jgi:glycosyltransferase involved in cell wall biosynthesis
MLNIVWLCSLSPSYYNEFVGLSESELKGMHSASWISVLLDEFSKRGNIKLTIISTSSEVSKNLIFTKNGIDFHILKIGKLLPGNKYLKARYNIVIYYLIRIIFLPVNWISILLFNIDKILLFRSFSHRTIKIIKKVKPDLINAHGTEYLYSAPLAYCKTPSVIEIQGFANWVVKTNNLLYWRLQAKVEKYCFRKVNNFIIHTKPMAQPILEENPSARLFYIHYPISNYIFTINNQPKDIDFAFYGRIIKEKGIEDFIEACKLIKLEKPGFKAKILGVINNDSYYNHLMNLIKEYNLKTNIIFEGFIESHIELMKKVSRCKFIVFPTHSDTSPGTIGESSGLGIPCISYNVGGVPDMIHNGINGYMVERGDIKGLAEKAILLLNNPVLIEKMGTEARIFANKHYSVEKIVDGMIDAYHAILNNN